MKGYMHAFTPPIPKAISTRATAKPAPDALASIATGRDVANSIAEPQIYILHDKSATQYDTSSMLE